MSSAKACVNHHKFLMEWTVDCAPAYGKLAHRSSGATSQRDWSFAFLPEHRRSTRSDAPVYFSVVAQLS